MLRPPLRVGEGEGGDQRGKGGLGIGEVEDLVDGMLHDLYLLGGKVG